MLDHSQEQHSNGAEAGDLNSPEAIAKALYAQSLFASLAKARITEKLEELTTVLNGCAAEGIMVHFGLSFDGEQRLWFMKQPVIMTREL